MNTVQPKIVTTSILLGLFIVSLFVSLYNLYFYNSFFPWTEGWFTLFASEMNHGKQLYRDIYYFMPPLYPKIIALFTNIFGYNIIFLRIFGIFIILGFSCCLFFIFYQFTTAIAASLAAVMVTIYYQHGNAHIPYDFFQFMNLAFVGSCLTAMWSFKLDEVHRLHSRNLAIFISGLSISAAALIKHSNGGVVGLLTFLTVSLFAFTLVKNKRFVAPG